MESYRKDAEQHGALLAFNCEVVGGNLSGLSDQQTAVVHLLDLLHVRIGMITWPLPDLAICLKTAKDSSICCMHHCRCCRCRGRSLQQP